MGSYILSFALFFETVIRPASGSWVWQSVLVTGSIVLCGCHCDFLSAMQEREKKNKLQGMVFQECHKVKHQDMVSLRKRGKNKLQGSFTKREEYHKVKHQYVASIKLKDAECSPFRVGG